MKLFVFACFFLAYMMLPGAEAFAQLIAGGDTTICKGGQVQLTASGGGVSYYWTSYPTDPSLLIPQQQNPVVAPQVTTMYVVQSNIATGNLILNGSFELGVVGFSSDYVNNQTSIYNEGTYAVVNDAHAVHPNFFCNQDHTTGAGKMMCVNGAGVPNVRVWYHTLANVQPETKYEFSTWITSLFETNPALLQFSINGQLMGEPFQAYTSTCDWYQFFHIWDSGPNTQATISIVNQNTILSGNDFALDDISFATVLVYYDTVWVEVIPVYTSAFTAATTAYIYEAIGVEYTGNAPVDANFNWDFGDAAILSGTGPGPYEIMYTAPGLKEISLWVGQNECSSDTTFFSITINDSPLGVFISVSPEEICPGEQATLTAQGYGGSQNFTYAWTSDPPGFSSHLPVVTVQPEQTTQYSVTVSDGFDIVSDTVALIVHQQPVAHAGDNQNIPHGTTAWLTGSVTGGSGIYLYHWEPATLLVNPSSAITQTVNLTSTTAFSLFVTDQISGCISNVDEVIVFIDGGPLAVTIIPDIHNLCEGETANLNAYVSGGNPTGYTYAWSDNFGFSYIAEPSISVSPSTTTTYQVTVSDGYASSSDIITITVFPSAEFSWNIQGDQYHTCPFETVELFPVPHPSDWSYLWSNGSTQSHITASSTGIGYSLQMYTLTVTTPQGCSWNNTVMVVFDFSYCSGIMETGVEQEVLVMPNPNQGYFSIIRPSSLESEEIRIFHPQHGLVFQQTFEKGKTEIEVDLSRFQAGLFIVQLISPARAVSRKVFILP
ncbi:MAG: T9SS type A sorting domain-containing protein [Bacteroidales bacterium]